jgi:serine protease SohB
MEYVYDYLAFLAKAVTVTAVVLAIIAAIVSAGSRRTKGDGGHLELRKLNDLLRDMQRSVSQTFLPHAQQKKALRRDKKQDKKAAAAAEPRRRVFVIDFHGDLHASAVEHLRHEVTAVLSDASSDDEVVVKIDSGGGMVHTYGLAASQLARVKEHGVKLTASIDKVAASGGYLMASVADHVLAAPFAVVGSIGVIAQIPNVHRLLKKHDVDVEVLTAGEYKRTLTVFGENTEDGRAKLEEELNDVHALFQEFVAENRPQVALPEVATGESWYGTRALERKLVDELITSDAYLCTACEEADVFEVRWVEHKKPIERLLSHLTGAWKSSRLGALTEYWTGGRG